MFNILENIYKHLNTKQDMDKKKGQVALFVVLAIVIVAAVILLFALRPELNPLAKEPEPSGYLEKCIRDATSDALNQLSTQGGSLSPTGFVLYDNNKVSYLCYTSDYYSRCVNQQPMLKYSVEYEISEYIRPKVQQCVYNLKQQYEKKGYEVETGVMKLDTTLQPKKVVIDMNMPLTVKKEETKRYENFQAIVLHPIYDHIMLSQDIVNSETHYGDFDQLSYMLYKPETSIDKKSQGDNTIYVIRDRSSNKRFLFAVRSYVMPPGL
jgi:hypothetical protein